MKFLLLSLCLITMACQKQEKSEPQFTPEMKEKIEAVVRRSEIIGRVTSLFQAVDDKDWTSVKDLLTDQVDFDMGEGAGVKSADDVISTWKSTITSIDGSHHAIPNMWINVKGEEAELRLVGTVTHFKKLKSGKNTRTLYGSYELTMVRPKDEKMSWAWKVSKFKYKNKFTDGNVNLK